MKRQGGVVVTISPLSGAIPTGALVGTIDTDQIADAAITAQKIGLAAVETAKLANLAVTAAILAANAVTETKIAPDAVTTPKLVAGAVTTGKIAAGAVTANEIAANAIIAGKIAAGTITAAELAAFAVTAGKIAALAVTADKIAANTITAAQIAAGAITTPAISAGAITAAEIAANAVDFATKVSGAAKPADYATSDVVLVASAGITLLGNNAEMVSGAPNTVQVYSRDAYLGGAFAQAIPMAGNPVFGLSTVPTTDASYASINYALNPNILTGVLQVVESGVFTGGFPACVAGDVFTIGYDGSRISYYKNGAGFRSIAVASGIKFSFDSAFESIGSKLNNIRFGPLSSNNAASVGIGRFVAGVNVAADTITANEIAALTITAAEIAAGTITSDKITVGTLSADRIVTGSISFTQTAERSGVKLRHSAAQAAADDVATILTWNTEDYDIGALHSTSVNPTRITVPAGYGNRVWLIAAQIFFGEVTTTTGVGTRVATISKNGQFFASTAVHAADGDVGTPLVYHQTAIPVFGFDPTPAVNDYYEILVEQNSGASMNVSTGSTFSAIHLW